MSAERASANEQRSLEVVGESARALFATAGDAEEAASLRDEVLRGVAQAADAARKRLADAQDEPAI